MLTPWFRFAPSALRRAGARLLVAHLALAVLLLSQGCIDDLTEQSFIERPRVLAGVASVVGNPTQAHPAPGETLRVEWLTVTNEDPQELSWLFLACPGVVLPTGDRLCGGNPYAIEMGDGTTDGAVPAIEVMVPDLPAPEVLILGVLCANGTPMVDPEALTASCSGEDATEEILSFGVPIARGGSSNTRPSPPTDFTIDGMPWAEAPIASDGCADRTDIPQLSLAAAAEVEITFRADPLDREDFVRRNGESDTEDLLVGNYTTSGSLGRLFSLVNDRNADDPVSSVDWELPAEPAVEGSAARFYFVMRDQRGGNAWTERHVCVVP